MHAARKVALVTCLSIGSLAFTISTQAQNTSGYELVEPPIADEQSGKIIVTEFFSYGCPHCFALDPALHEWEQSMATDILFRREAPALNKFWKYRSQAFYAAEQLGLSKQLHRAYFNAIHEEGRKLKKRDQILEFIGELGFDQQEFAAAMDSPEVQARMELALTQAKAAGITGVPTIVVNGKYKTGTRIAGDQHKVVDVIRNLIAKERQ